MELVPIAGSSMVAAAPVLSRDDTDGWFVRRYTSVRYGRGPTSESWDEDCMSTREVRRQTALHRQAGVRSVRLAEGVYRWSWESVLPGRRIVNVIIVSKIN